MLGKMTDLERATEMLRGIVAGISADYHVSDAEVAKLTQWLDMHENLANSYPFKELRELLAEILEDSVITEDERDDLLLWCQTFSDSTSYVLTSMTASMRRLHGFLHGIAIDGEITEAEVRDLRNWLTDHEHLTDCWPYSEVVQKVDQILEDDIVTLDERRELQEFCERFSERSAESPLSHDTHSPVTEPWMESDAPILQTLVGICAKNPKIVFEQRKFCFTGKAQTGSRKDLEAIVTEYKGTSVRNVTLDLSYLVVGAMSQPCWAYSTYGRKIEQVMKYRNEGAQILIIHEDSFLEALKA